MPLLSSHALRPKRNAPPAASLASARKPQKHLATGPLPDRPMADGHPPIRPPREENPLAQTARRPPAAHLKPAARPWTR